jgi:hypothetical protein
VTVLSAGLWRWITCIKFLLLSKCLIGKVSNSVGGTITLQNSDGCNIHFYLFYTAIYSYILILLCCVVVLLCCFIKSLERVITSQLQMIFKSPLFNLVSLEARLMNHCITKNSI